MPIWLLLLLCVHVGALVMFLKQMIRASRVMKTPINVVELITYTVIYLLLGSLILIVRFIYKTIHWYQRRRRAV